MVKNFQKLLKKKKRQRFQNPSTSKVDYEEEEKMICYIINKQQKTNIILKENLKESGE